MHKLAYGALAIGLLVACGGGGSDSKTVKVPDAGSAAASCNPITQSGCTTGEKCTWVQDTESVGHVGCEPTGTAADGAACMFGSGGSNVTFPTYDNCVGGDICINSKCEVICDNMGGSAACKSGYACAIYSGLFEVNGNFEAGACDKECDPLSDNGFGSGGSGDIIPPRTGNTCDSTQGCYGFPSTDSTNPTHFTCSGEVNHGLAHRSQCTMADGCAPDSSSVYLNGCAQGYLPLEYEVVSGADVQICAAMCAPKDCYMGNCGSDNTASTGTSPHQCAATAVRTGDNVTYTFPTDGANSCYYWWSTEFDDQGSQHPSQYDNSLGICLDHDQYKFDPTGGMNPTSNWPDCKDLPGSGSAGSAGTNAADWACISLTTAASLGDEFQANRKGGPVIDRPRIPQEALQLLKRTR